MSDRPTLIHSPLRRQTTTARVWAICFSVLAALAATLYLLLSPRTLARPPAGRYVTPNLSHVAGLYQGPGKTFKPVPWTVPQ